MFTQIFQHYKIMKLFLLIAKFFTYLNYTAKVLDKTLQLPGSSIIFISFTKIPI